MYLYRINKENICLYLREEVELYDGIYPTTHAHNDKYKYQPSRNLNYADVEVDQWVFENVTNTLRSL